MSVETTEVTTETLIHQFGLGHWALKTNVEGLTHEDSLVQPSLGGNCLNWVTGHVLHSRNAVLQILGRDPVWLDPRADRYKRGTPPITDGTEAAPFNEMLDAIDASQEPLIDALKQATGEFLAQKAPFSPADDPNETNGSLLAGFAFHEAYSVGQVGLLRRIIGKDGAIK